MQTPLQRSTRRARCTPGRGSGIIPEVEERRCFQVFRFFVDRVAGKQEKNGRRAFGRAEWSCPSSHSRSSLGVCSKPLEPEDCHPEARPRMTYPGADRHRAEGSTYGCNGAWGGSSADLAVTMGSVDAAWAASVPRELPPQATSHPRLDPSALPASVRVAGSTGPGLRMTSPFIPSF